jgi:hypothetical protein
MSFASRFVGAMGKGSAFAGPSRKELTMMMDQLFMRHWAANHDQFSRDLDKGLAALAARLRRIRLGRPSIGQAYGSVEDGGTSRAGRAMLTGLAASATTTLLFTAVGLLALPPGALA